MRRVSQPSMMHVDRGTRIGIVHSSYYPTEVQALVSGATATLRNAGINEGNILVVPVAGSFEIPLLGAALAEEGKVDALIGLGVIVEGETHHAELLARECVRGIMDIQVRSGIPFAFEVLYVRSLAEAQARRTKGEEAALAVLHSLAELERIRS